MDDVEKLEAAEKLTPLIEYMNSKKKPFPLEILLKAFKVPKDKFLKWMANDELRTIFQEKIAIVHLEHLDQLMTKVAELKPEFLLKTIYSEHFHNEQPKNLIDEATQMTEAEALDVCDPQTKFIDSAKE